MNYSDIYCCDFETTVFAGQTFTEVWASAIAPLTATEPNDVYVCNSIEKTFEYLIKLNKSIKCYFHNLKFDGSFWLSFLIKKLGFKQAFTPIF